VVCLPRGDIYIFFILFHSLSRRFSWRDKHATMRNEQNCNVKDFQTTEITEEATVGRTSCAQYALQPTFPVAARSAL